MPDGATPSGEAAEPKFVLETDEAPEFWQFLHGMRGDDLLVELIVNDLDARSPRTVIRFEPERLVCAGEGDPIDEEGWQRLRKMRGGRGLPHGFRRPEPRGRRGAGSGRRGRPARRARSRTGSAGPVCRPSG